MPATGPGEAPPVVVRRKRRVQRRQARAQRVSSRAPGQAHERPTAPTPSVRPASRPARPPRVVHRPVAAPAGDTKSDVHAGQGFKGTRPYRGAVTASYDTLSGREKHRRVSAAASRVAKGTATEADHAILHIHRTRVAGNAKRAKLAMAFNALGGPTTAQLLAESERFTGPKRIAGAGTNVRSRKADVSIGDKIAGAIRAVGKASSEGWKSVHAPKVIRNVPTDIAELAVTTPSSLAKLASDVVHHPGKVPGELAAPYVELAKHPGKFITEHPASAALMLAPAVRAPGRIAGKGLRLAGKQTLERPAAEFAGTNLRDVRTGSKDAVVRAVQSRRDAKRVGAHPQAPKPGTRAYRDVVGKVNRVTELQDRGATAGERSAATAARDRVLTRHKLRIGDEGQIEAEQVVRGPQMTDKQVGRRVDEFYDTARKRETAAVAKAHAQARELGAGGEELQAHVEKARKRARKQTDRAFAHEFGGEMHPTREAAQAAAAQLPFDATIRKVGRGKFTNVPTSAAKRLNEHRRVGSSKAVGSKVMRTANRMFAGAVLPTSPRWLAGQGIEAGLRSAVAGAGPASLLREARTFRALEREKPGAGEEFRARTSGGGQFAAGSTVRDFMEGRITLADTFKGTPLEKPAAGATRVGKVPGVRHVREGYREYSRVVMDTVNGAIEGTARRAMAGKALKESPLMERSIVGLSDRAIDEAAKGLKATEAQVALGRAVDRAYGRYSKFSPAKRETLMHSTPFYPWYRNTVEFLTRVLPVDHPMHAALVADLDAATEDWRKAHGLSLRGGKRVPEFLLGRAPAGKGYAAVGRYLPFAPADVAGSAADLVFPAFSGPLLNLRGVEWTGQRLKGKPIPAAALTAAETYVPGLAQSDRISGVSRAVRKSGRVGIAQGTPTGRALREEFDPFVATQPPKPKVRRKGKGKRKVVRVSNPLLRLP